MDLCLRGKNEHEFTDEKICPQKQDTGNFLTATHLNFVSVGITCEYIHFAKHFSIMGGASLGL